MENRTETSRITERRSFQAEFSGLQGEPRRPEVTKPRFQRIALTGPLIGTLNGIKAVVMDISLSGALVAHQVGLTAGDRIGLRFDWKGDPINLSGRVTRTEIHKPGIKQSRAVYRSGISFQQFERGSEQNLRTMIGDLVTRALDEQRANARGLPAQAASSSQRGANSRGYLALRFVDGTWRRRETIDRSQPSDGFAVCIEEQPGQITMLCSTYEKLPEIERILIRNMAALSIANVDGAPARRYQP